MLYKVGVLFSHVLASGPGKVEEDFIGTDSALSTIEEVFGFILFCFGVGGIGIRV